MDVEAKRGRPPDMFVTYAHLLNSRLQRATKYAKNEYPTLKVDFDWVSLTVEDDGCHCSCVLCVWSDVRSLFSLKHDDGRRYGNLLVKIKPSSFVNHLFTQAHTRIVAVFRDFMIQNNIANAGKARAKRIDLKTAIKYAANDPVKLLQITKQYVLWCLRLLRVVCVFAA